MEGTEFVTQKVSKTALQLRFGVKTVRVTVRRGWGQQCALQCGGVGVNSARCSAVGLWLT